MKNVVEKSEQRRPLGKLRRIWDDNIRMDLKETVGKRGLDASGSGQAEVAGACEHDNKPSEFHKRPETS
jgi:hypothetical protein